jgi:hypothetical protein
MSATKPMPPLRSLANAFRPTEIRARISKRKKTPRFTWRGAAQRYGRTISRWGQEAADRFAGWISKEVA